MAFDPRTTLPAGASLYHGAYRIESCLGMGGFGITYRALDLGLNRPVAVKEFFPAACIREKQCLTPGGKWAGRDLDAYRQKFMEEGRILARLDHPGIVRVFSVFEENATVYLVMQFLEGQTLEEYQSDRGGRLPVEEAVGFIRQAGEALEVVHASGLLHRDIKPANLMRRTSGQVVMIDFGASREFVPDAVLSHSVIVSRGFAPPEQYDRRAARGPYTDVYGLAATLYYLLTEEVPTESPIRLVEDHVPAPQELRSDVSSALSAAIMKGLQPRASDRPVTVAAWLSQVLPPSPLSAGAIRFNPIDGAEMIFIPAGDFLMGDDDLTNDDGVKNPRHRVTLSGYWIYKNLVTVGMYRKFCQMTGRNMPDAPRWGWKDDHPMVNVSWTDAEAYCAWAGVRLPTEAEWEKAARGTDGRLYPWGNVWDASKCQCSKNQLGDAGGTSAVGSYPSGASPYGVLDMAGNVNQWCSDWYDKGYLQTGPGDNPIGPRSGKYRVLRGCEWYIYDPYLFPYDKYFFRSADRTYGEPGRRNVGIGFRCVSGL